MGKGPINGPLATADQEATGRALQDSLVDLIDLSLVAKQTHWNVVGPHFRSVHLQLDELVAVARQYSDQVAERAVALGYSPDGRATTVAKDSVIDEFKDGWIKDRDAIVAIVKALDLVIKRMRARIEATESTDPVTQDLLIGLTAKLEEAHWMWQAQLA